MNEVKPMSRLKCPLIFDSRDIFFSLVDYRNSRFTSENPDKIIEFYDSFKNRDDLIEWMKERPKGVAYIHEVEGDKDLIVVIPTADFSGKYARECRENIFKGLHMVFVESGGRGDFFFNIAHNCNIGIKKALEYNPKWVVVSNDDVYKIDAVSVLKKELSSINLDRIKVVFISQTKYHSYPASLATARIGRSILFSILGKLRRYQLSLERRYAVNHFLALSVYYYGLFFKRSHPKIRAIGNFGIFSKYFIRDVKGILFDETYISGGEDLDLSLVLCKEHYYVANWRLGDFYGSALGKNTPEGVRNIKGTTRRLRDVANMAYFNFKLDSGFFTQTLSNNEETEDETK